MLEVQFLLINAHFTVNLLAALTCFAVAWLYFDAWLGRHDIKEGTKSLGFILLTVSFVAHATQIEQSILANPFFGSEIIDIIASSSRILAFIVLIFGQFIDPLQPLPTYRAVLDKDNKGFGIKNPKSAIIVGGLPLVGFLHFTYPIFSAFTGFLYLRRATLGLEFHLRTIAFSLFILSLHDLMGLSSLFRGSDNISLENLVAPFGVVWIVEHLILVGFIFVLGKWVWFYLAKRLETQLFIIFNTVILFVFLLTAIFFTSVSIANLRASILDSLKTNVSVLDYTIGGKKSEMLSDAELFAQNPELVTAISETNREKLVEISVASLLTKNKDLLVVVDTNGAILARGDDPEKVGGSLSDDQLVKKALNGEKVSGIVTRDGVMAPTISVRASVPVKRGDEVLGAVIIGSLIDNPFVDGLKSATGLDASVYADNVRSATTFIAPDGKSRWIGITEENENVKKIVLNEGNTYSGPVSILNISYLSAFSPIKNIDDNPIGMLFVGTPEVATLQAAARLIEQTFIVTVVLLVLSVAPSFFVSKYIIEQIR